MEQFNFYRRIKTTGFERIMSRTKVDRTAKCSTGYVVAVSIGDVLSSDTVTVANKGNKRF